MSAQDARSFILSFAALIGRSSQPAEQVARRRNWIGEDGAPTEDGMALIDALDDQSATRTVFRGNF